MCGLTSYGTLREDIANQVIGQHIPQALEYPCRYWMYHLKKVRTEEWGKDVSSFLKKHFIHWLEAIDLMELASEAVGIISTLQSKAVDGYRFVLPDDQHSSASSLLLWTRVLPNRQYY
ncbi:NACHT and WD40 domain protein [Penicillium longicatenatum]|uniref:NACHT and WD40 domain protein n=1 Tax=Penicillium longicatenatum TaxID=1561947 RepID=UPI0025481FEC|nr:NACHT and WD40 domain protein [Penicillium longicatenatum]KAJ5648792.1 NACHT and WD40 domain protein [Penicillium longicatenatum]